MVQLSYFIQSFFQTLGLGVVVRSLIVEGVTVLEHPAKVGQELLNL
jgi:hypothetical protein